MPPKLLIVDDSKTVRLIVRKAFKGCRCEVLEAGDGAEGLAIARRKIPDLILLDVTMPVMDGLELLRRLQFEPALAAIPVILLTAGSRRDQAARVTRPGVRGWLAKPFQAELLIETAGRLIPLTPPAMSPPPITGDGRGAGVRAAERVLESGTLAGR
jgi:two-component system cell cycle response regulator